MGLFNCVHGNAGNCPTCDVIAAEARTTTAVERQTAAVAAADAAAAQRHRGDLARAEALERVRQERESEGHREARRAEARREDAAREAAARAEVDHQLAREAEWERQDAEAVRREVEAKAAQETAELARRVERALAVADTEALAEGRTLDPVERLDLREAVEAEVEEERASLRRFIAERERAQREQERAERERARQLREAEQRARDAKAAAERDRLAAQAAAHRRDMEAKEREQRLAAEAREAAEKRDIWRYVVTPVAGFLALLGGGMVALSWTTLGIALAVTLLFRCTLGAMRDRRDVFRGCRTVFVLAYAVQAVPALLAYDGPEALGTSYVYTSVAIGLVLLVLLVPARTYPRVLAAA